jgi:GT2 family glycosyltransferase
MISVLIPTYKEPEALDLCLKSAIEGQNNENQIIVVVDGFYELNKSVLEKYSKHIDILNLEENVGLPRATNLGVYNAQYDKILIVNDDNVFPINWDTELEKIYEPNSVISPNQIEPIPSIFSQFIIENLGRNPQTFDLKKFWGFEIDISTANIKQETGSTLPIFMSKLDYLKVGGWDESYPGAWVVDWDFFLKCKLSGMKMIRTYNIHFYHFVSIGTESTPEEKLIKHHKEIECHQFAQYKWGASIKHNPLTNEKYL